MLIFAEQYIILLDRIFQLRFAPLQPEKTQEKTEEKPPAAQESKTEGEEALERVLDQANILALTFSELKSSLQEGDRAASERWKASQPLLAKVSGLRLNSFMKSDSSQMLNFQIDLRDKLIFGSDNMLDA